VAIVDSIIGSPAATLPQADEMERAGFLADALLSCADRNGYFHAAATSLLVPPAALSEVVESIEAYKSEPLLALKAVVPALKRAARAIDRSLAGAVRSGADVAAYTALAQGAISRENSQGILAAYLSSNHQAISAAAALAADSYNVASAYILELSSMMTATITQSAKFSISEKARLFSVAREVVAAVANQGRTPEVFAERASEILHAGSDAAKVAQSLGAFMAEPTDRFQVAVVVDGTVRTEGLQGGVFERVDHGMRVHWRTPHAGSSWPTADMDLARFCLHHWGIRYSDADTYRHDVDAQVLITEVQAWDGEQARHVALDRAEELVDKINAEHRTSHFGVKRKVMVWPEGNRVAREIFRKTRTLPRTRQMRISDGPSVSRSLRFASRAAGERAGSMQVFFSWIALEYLGRGGAATPQNLVAKHAPYAVGLVELRHLISLVWVQVASHLEPSRLPHEVRHAIKRGDTALTSKSNPNHFDMSKLLALVVADGGHTDHLESVAGLTKAEAEAAIREWVSVQRQISTFAAFRVRHVRDVLRDDTRFQKHLDEIRLDADEVLQRMRFVRNQTAHNAGVGSTEHLPLSDAALKVLDAVFEVLPQWNREPQQALIDISARWKAVRTAVTNRLGSRHVSPFDPSGVHLP
jgi:hypothetical protein